MQAKLLYVSFDQVPAPKGASTHILAFTEALGREFGNVVLITPGEKDQVIPQFRVGVDQYILGTRDTTPIGRAKTFRAKLSRILERQVFQVIHFRSIFEGIPLITPELNRGAKLVFEVNGIPSIEMKYHYPQLTGHPQFISKLIEQETACLESADRILTVSNVNANFIRSRSSQIENIEVIPNGVHLNQFGYKAPASVSTNETIRVVYIGTTSPWQGVEVLLTAVAQLNKQRACHLKIVSAPNRRRMRHLKQQIDRLKIESQVECVSALTPAEVAGHLHSAHMTVAPLLKLDRNTVQGCCPIKVIEAMASGCPLIASNIPVVEELAKSNLHYLPAKSGDANNLKNLILQLANDHDLACRLSKAAREHVEKNFTWDHATDSLLEVYRGLLSTDRS